MLPHFLAVLGLFADLDTIDNISVPRTWQYAPPPTIPTHGGATRRFLNETASRVRFTILDHSGSKVEVPCEAVVGKGFNTSVKYFEMTGANVNHVRIDFARELTDAPHGYPNDHVFLLHSSGGPGIESMKDPYCPGRRLHVDTKGKWRLHKDRYQQLLTDLITGSRGAIGSTLTINEAYSIVAALDRIWRAVRARADWSDPLQVPPIGTLNPMTS